MLSLRSAVGGLLARGWGASCCEKIELSGRLTFWDRKNRVVVTRLKSWRIGDDPLRKRLLRSPPRFRGV